MPDLKPLIAELEAAKEGSRKLDQSVARAVGYRSSWRAGGETRFYAPGKPQGSNSTIAKPFTTSLDAALTLVPKDKLHWLVVWSGGFSAQVSIPIGEREGGGASKGATAALAFCIAALKARENV